MEPATTISEMAGKLFPLLFNMMGPIGVIPVFAALTPTLDRPAQTAVALRATLLSFAALAVAVFIGASVLESWGISRGSLILAAGVIVTLSALQPLFFKQKDAPAGAHTPPSPRDLATSPLAFPTIVSPKAIAVLIIFVAFFPAMEAKFAVFAVAGAMLILDFFGMLAAGWFMATIGMVPLLVLGAVFGVLQVALGIEMIVDGWRALAGP